MAATAPLDFRFLDEGLGGAASKKRKRDEDAAEAQLQAETSQMEVDEVNFGEQQQSKRQAVEGNGDKPAYGKPTFDGVIAGKVSGRSWKAPEKSRASSRRVSIRGTSLEERTRLKRISEAYKIRKNELKEQIRVHKVEKRKRMEDHKKRKEENTRRTGLKLQKITNPKTIKKMSKKERKKLMTV